MTCVYICIYTFIHLYSKADPRPPRKAPKTGRLPRPPRWLKRARENFKMVAKQMEILNGLLWLVAPAALREACCGAARLLVETAVGVAHVGVAATQLRGSRTAHVWQQRLLWACPSWA